MLRIEIDIETLNHKEGVGGETRVTSRMLANITNDTQKEEDLENFAPVELGFAQKILGIVKMALTMTGAAAPVGPDGKPLWNPNGVARGVVTDTDGQPVHEAGTEL